VAQKLSYMLVLVSTIVKVGCRAAGMFRYDHSTQRAPPWSSVSPAMNSAPGPVCALVGTGPASTHTAASAATTAPSAPA
jgi:hypothetical protein